MDSEKLWYVALHGSVISAAMALTILDQQLDGQITELKQKVENKDG